MFTLKQLNISGFRSLKEVEWKPAALNIVIGPNGSGKSNLIKAIELLSACARGTLSKFVNQEGGLWTLRWDGSDDPLISVGLDIDPPISLAKEAAFAIQLRTGVAIDRFRGEYQVYEQLTGRFAVEVSEEAAMEGPQEWMGDEEVALFVRNDEGINILSIAVSDPDGMDSHRNESMLATFTGGEPSVDLSSQGNVFVAKGVSRYLRIARFYRQFQTRQGSTVRTSVVSRRELQVDEDGENVLQVLHTLYTEDRPFEQNVNDAMRAAFGDDFEELKFVPASDQRIQMRIRWKSLKHDRSAADMSDGTLRFLYLLAILGTPNPPPLIVIEEPEVGLHPSMLPIIAEFAQAASEKCQVIFTTHSIAFLDAFSDKNPQITVTQMEEGQTKVKVLDGVKLASWLNEYSLGSLYATGELEAME
ncbi:MAG: AAA family ATPase [Planctomycetota bacterium]|nr:AAA family ATPase [Planctomycetota bacterium]